MFVRRERGETLDGDRERTRWLVEDVRKSCEPGLRVWQPPSHVSFGRRDANGPQFDRARAVADEQGYPTVVRSSGGRAVAHTEGTLAIALATPIDDERAGIHGRYEVTIDALRRALAECGVDVERGEPPDSFCPGSHSLQVRGRKVVGLAQRVRRDVATLTGIVIVTDERTVADLLEPVYGALDVPFEPRSVGSVASAGGRDVIEHVGDAVVAAIRTRTGE